MVRKTITLPEEVVRDIEKLSDGNFSAFAAEALARTVRRHNLRTLITDLEAETGPITQAERDAARARRLGA